MNPRELIARLNVPAVRYEIGRGGIPELTNIDIAAALGMIGKRQLADGTWVDDEGMAFARDVFMALWWEDGAKRGRVVLDDRIRQLILREFGERGKALSVAKLEQHMAETEIAAKKNPTAFDDRILRACKAAVADAKERVWSYNASIFAAIPGAVIYEIHHPRYCDDCRGRGEVRATGLLMVCPVCKGSRVKPEKSIERAKQLRTPYVNYRQRWQRIYEWTYGLVTRADAEAAKAFGRAVSRDLAA